MANETTAADSAARTAADAVTPAAGWRQQTRTEIENSIGPDYAPELLAVWERPETGDLLEITDTGDEPAPYAICWRTQGDDHTAGAKTAETAAAKVEAMMFMANRYHFALQRMREHLTTW